MFIPNQYSYKLNEEIPLEIDTVSFVKHSQIANAADDPETQITNFEKMAVIYKGTLSSVFPNSTWIISISQYYHNIFINSLYKLLDHYINSERYSDIISLCNHFLGIDLYDEAIHRYLIQAYNLLGDNKNSIKHYKHAREVFLRDLNVDLSHETVALYDIICKCAHNTPLKLNDIINNINELEEYDNGALYCEYETFKRIYLHYKRLNTRTNFNVFLVLFTLTPKVPSKTNSNNLGNQIHSMKDIPTETLRKGDVVSRCSVNQYIVILPLTPLNHGLTTVYRIMNNFDKKSIGKKINLSYSFQVLE